MSTLFTQMIENNQAFSIDDAYFTNWKNYSMDYHTHGSLEINYVTSGTCIYYVDSKKYILKKKNLPILDSSIPHKLEFFSPDPCLILGMSYGKIEKKPGLISLTDLITTSPSTNSFFYKLWKFNNYSGFSLCLSRTSSNF